MAPKVRVCIITRFSVLTRQRGHSWRMLRYPLDPRTWWRNTNNPTLAEKSAYLFAPARLDARFRRFEALLLPSLAAQTEPAEHIVLCSSLMPQPYRDRLDALAGRYGFRLHAVGTDRRIERVLMQDGLIDLAGHDRLATVRIDDDDAVATVLVREVRRHALLDIDDYILTFPKGIYLDERVTPNRYATVVEPNLACGLTRVLRKPRKTLSIYGTGNHRTVHHTYPVLQVPTRDMYLMTTHRDNVSRRFFLRRLPGSEPLTPEAAGRLQARFGIRLGG